MSRHGAFAARAALTPEPEEVVEAIPDLPHVGEADRLAAEELTRLLTIAAAIDKPC